MADDNLRIYNAVREVPKSAIKSIQAGRLKGKSDINPMWRLKTLTEQFGPCGIGWKYEIVKVWLENGAKNEISAFVQINIYVKNGDAWSDAIPGIGGSAFVAAEHSGLYTSDECYKMALTDAISVACKALGVAANVYWDNDKSKYDKPADDKPPVQGDKAKPTGKISKQQATEMWATMKNKFGGNATGLVKTLTGHEKLGEIPAAQYDTIMLVIKNYEP